MNPNVKAYINSTIMDLPVYQDMVKIVCRQHHISPVIFKDLTVSDEDYLIYSLKMLDTTDIYIGIIANRYGGIPKGQSTSIMEWEYRRARERGIPCLIFVMDDKYAGEQIKTYTTAYQDSKLQHFKTELMKSHVVAFVTTPQDFKAKLNASLKDLRKRLELHPEPCEGYAIMLELDLPGGLSEEEIHTQIADIADDLDSLHRAHGGHGLTVRDLEIHEESSATQGVIS